MYDRDNCKAFVIGVHVQRSKIIPMDRLPIARGFNSCDMIYPVPRVSPHAVPCRPAKVPAGSKKFPAGLHGEFARKALAQFHSWLRPFEAEEEGFPPFSLPQAPRSPRGVRRGSRHPGEPLGPRTAPGQTAESGAATCSSGFRSAATAKRAATSGGGEHQRGGEHIAAEDALPRPALDELAEDDGRGDAADAGSEGVEGRRSSGRGFRSGRFR